MTTAGRRDWGAFLAGVDPGLTRLRLASVAVAAVLLAVGGALAIRTALAPGEPVTMVLYAGMLALFSNIAVNEPTLRRRRITTAVLVLPAVAATAVGALLAPHRLLAGVAFVAVIVTAVWVRRSGPRAEALGMITFVGFYATQFLGAKPEQVGWLVLAAVIGIASTWLMRCAVFAERPERTLRRLLGAFRARAHGLVRTADRLLAEPASARHAADGDENTPLRRLRTSRDRLSRTALLVEDQLEGDEGAPQQALVLRVVDAELAFEGLAVATRRLLHVPQHERDVLHDDPHPEALGAVRAGLDQLAHALEPGASRESVLDATTAARAAVREPAGIVAPEQERVRTAALAVIGIADAVETLLHETTGTQREAPATDGFVEPAESPPGPDAPGDDGRQRPEVDLHTRQAVQVGVGAALAIAVSGLIAPQRWYWAVLTAFVVFTGTRTRGDLLARGWSRVLGTVGGVLGGAGLALLVGENRTLSFVLLMVGMFLVLYVAQISPAAQAFFITTTVALLYGLIGQFRPEILLLRLAETAIGVVCAVLAAYLVLPKGSRAAFGEAAHGLVDAMDDVLGAAAERLTGGAAGPVPREVLRAMHDALAELRRRAEAVTGPFSGRRPEYRRAVRAMTVAEHYLGMLGRRADRAGDPSWAATLVPAVERIRGNLADVGDLLAAESRGEQLRSADELLDVVRPDPAAPPDEGALELLRRLDRALVGLGADLGRGSGRRSDEPAGSAVAAPEERTTSS